MRWEWQWKNPQETERPESHGSDDIDQMVSGNNTNLVLNSIGWMTEQEDSTTIRPKSTESTTLRLTFGQAMQWTLLFVAVIPLVVLAVGIVVCVRRRCQK